MLLSQNSLKASLLCQDELSWTSRRQNTLRRGLHSAGAHASSGPQHWWPEFRGPGQCHQSFKCTPEASHKENLSWSQKGPYTSRYIQNKMKKDSWVFWRPEEAGILRSYVWLEFGKLLWARINGARVVLRHSRAFWAIFKTMNLSAANFQLALLMLVKRGMENSK